MINLIGVYKPKGPSSNQFLTRIKRAFDVKKVGHAGTLDPLASGILVIGIGREATKQLHTAVKKEKEYLAKIRLGMNSTTYDEEGKKSFNFLRKLIFSVFPPKNKKIRETLKIFEGHILQQPPIFSALKIKGQPAYKLARAGKRVNLEAREVDIKKIELIEYKWPYLIINVTTGPGVYIRSLAYDIGKKLGTRGYLRELERTRVGDFTKDNSMTIEELAREYKKKTSI